MKGIYLVGGYPDRARFLECAEAVAASGFDFIEIGIPFNDPIADGPVIAHAIRDAIALGVTPGGVMEDVCGMNDPTPARFIMTYANIIHAHGIGSFSDKMEGHLQGVIIPDLPNRMARVFQEQGFRIPIVPFATLETRADDAALMAGTKSPFVYFVGVRGVTGAAGDLKSVELRRQLALLREHAGTKIIIGFGIKTAADAARAMELADGFVVGTEAVRRQKDPDKLHKYLAGLQS